MIYGLDNYIFVNPLSILNAIILVFGIFKIGLVTQKIILNKFFLIKNNNDIYFYSFLFGTYIVSYFLYILIIFQVLNLLIFKIIAITIYCLGLFFLISFFCSKENFANFKKITKFNYYFYIIIITLVGLLLISLSPITHVDSLGYHIYSAINILNHGSFETELLPMTSKLSSIGETMISLGLALKIEQFGALIQFSSLFALIPIILKQKKEFNYLILLIILITPITIFFISSPKPQLLECIGSFLVFTFLVNNFFNYKNNQIKIILTIIFLILSINVLVKYTFIISSSVLYIYCIYLMYKKNFLKEALLISVGIFIITILPNWLHRYLYFETTFPDLLISPLPINIYGYEKLNNIVSQNGFNLISLIIPSGFGQVSTFYGPILFIVFFIKSSSFKRFKNYYVIIFIFSILHIIVGTTLSRFFYEGYLWFMYLVLISQIRVNKYLLGFMSLLKIQILFGILLTYLLAFNLFPGSLNKELREKVMKNNASGYSLAKWVNEKLDIKSVVLTTNRSLSLYNNEAYEDTFETFVNFNNDKSNIYSNYLKEKKIDKIVFHGEKINYGPFKNCLGPLYAHKENVEYWASRNPFNRNQKAYNWWIYEFKNELLPACLVK